MPAPVKKPRIYRLEFPPHLDPALPYQPPSLPVSVEDECSAGTDNQSTIDNAFGLPGFDNFENIIDRGVFNIDLSFLIPIYLCIY